MLLEIKHFLQYFMPKMEIRPREVRAQSSIGSSGASFGSRLMTSTGQSTFLEQYELTPATNILLIIHNPTPHTHPKSENNVLISKNVELVSHEATSWS